MTNDLIMHYRVNYGNGQVSQTFASKKAAFAHRAGLDLYREYSSVEFYVDGDWFYCDA